MKGIKSVFFVLFLAIFVLLSLQSQCISSCSEYGCEQGEFMGVIAYGNGGYTETGEYQCVEFAKRFYRKAFGVVINQAVGSAKNFYIEFKERNLKRFGLVKISNGGEIKPVPGDMVIFSGGSYGHVAIFCNITKEGDAKIIEQNYDQKKCFRDLSYSEDSYTLEGTEAYPVLGWLRFAPGRYEDGFHDDGTSQAFLDAYRKHKDIIGHPYDNDGGVFVHEWESPTDPSYSVWIQDFYNPDTDKHYSLILNDLESPKKAYLLQGAIRNFYMNHDGPYNYGVPFTGEISGKLANSHLTAASDFVRPSSFDHPDSQVEPKQIIVQKFKQRVNGEYNNERRTIVHDPDTGETRHFPVGQFFFQSLSCDGSDHQMYLYNYGGNDIPWPVDDCTVPTGVWFLKPGSYNFVLHNADGSRRYGWGLTVAITEGNWQYADQEADEEEVPLFAPSDLEFTSIKQDSLTLTWNRGLNNEDFDLNWNVYRWGILIDTVDKRSYQVSLEPYTAYKFRVSAEYQDRESDLSEDIIYKTEAIESSSGYTYQSSTICDGWSHGSPDYWNLEPVDPRSSFAAGEPVCVLSKIKDVTVDHRWKTEFFRNGELTWTDESPWQDVGPGWDYSSAHPVLRNIRPGDHRVKVWLDSGSGYEKLADKSFTVSDYGQSNFFAGATICEDWDYGSSDYWDLQPVNPKAEFAAGDPVCCLAQVENVINDHRWKIEFFRNGGLIWTDESPWQDVGAGWDYSSVHPILQNTDPGDYKVKVWFDSGSGYDLKTSKSFHVNHPPLQPLPYEEDFSDSDHGFVLENNNGQGGMREAMIDGRNCLVIENGLSDEQWKVQVKKTGFDITGGTVYNHQITVKASKPGTIYACLQRNVDPWDNFGMWHGINVTTDWQTFSFQFTTSSSLKPEEVRYSIQAGKIAGEIYVDNVKLQ